MWAFSVAKCSTYTSYFVTTMRCKVDTCVNVPQLSGTKSWRVGTRNWQVSCATAPKDCCKKTHSSDSFFKTKLVVEWASYVLLLRENETSVLFMCETPIATTRFHRQTKSCTFRNYYRPKLKCSFSPWVFNN